MQFNNEIFPSIQEAFVKNEDVVQPKKRPDIAVAWSIKEILIIDDQDYWSGDPYLVAMVTDGLSDKFSVTKRSWQGIVSGDNLDIFDEGLLIYYYEGEAPPFLDLKLLVMEADKDIDTLHKTVERIQESSGFKDYEADLGKLIVEGASAINPYLAVANTAFDFIAGSLKDQEDDFVGLATCTYTWRFDNLGEGIHPSPDHVERIQIPGQETVKEYNLYRAGDFAFKHEIKIVGLE